MFIILSFPIFSASSVFFISFINSINFSFFVIFMFYPFSLLSYVHQIDVLNVFFFLKKLFKISFEIYLSVYLWLKWWYFWMDFTLNKNLNKKKGFIIHIWNNRIKKWNFRIDFYLFLKHNWWKISSWSISWYKSRISRYY